MSDIFNVCGRRNHFYIKNLLNRWRISEEICLHHVDQQMNCETMLFIDLQEQLARRAVAINNVFDLLSSRLFQVIYQNHEI